MTLPEFPERKQFVNRKSQLTDWIEECLLDIENRLDAKRDSAFIENELHDLVRMLRLINSEMNNDQS